MNEVDRLARSEQLGAAKEANIYLLRNDGEVSHYWPEIEKSLNETRELWQDTFTLDSILARALTGRIQVWVVSRDETLDLALMTQAYQTDVSKVLQVFWAFGHGLREVLSLIEILLDRFAAEIGADRIEVVGRPAFVRLLLPLGGTFQSVTCGRSVRPVMRN